MKNGIQTEGNFWLNYSIALANVGEEKKMLHNHSSCAKTKPPDPCIRLPTGAILKWKILELFSYSAYWELP